MSSSSAQNGRGGLGGGLGGALGSRTSPLTKIVQGVAGGIGLVSESYYHNKEKRQAKKAQEQAQENQSDETPSELGITDTAIAEQVDEAAWQLDEAQDTATVSANIISPSQPESSDIAESFITNHPLVTPIDGQTVTPHLPLPVVLIQRRPKARERGFVHAYAPILGEVGIDEATFLDFADKLNKAVEPSPWLNAINLASFAGMHVPEPFTLMISVAAAIVTQAALEMHSRSKTNIFLDRVNAEFFRPRGLICLIMTWRPQGAAEPMTTVDFQGHIAATAGSDSPHEGTFNKLKHNLQSSSGADAFEWPETAPLIFPVLDEMATTDVDKKKENTLKRGGKFVGEYMDQRAQAKWAGKHADSKIANSVPKPEFHSRYADPNHPASSGDLLALLTGGALQMPPLPGRGQIGGGTQLGNGRGFGGLGIIAAQRRGYTQDIRGGNGGRAQLGGGGIEGVASSPLIKGVKKILQKDILYLMIVNLPTEQEMADATATMAQARTQG